MVIIMALTMAEAFKENFAILSFFNLCDCVKKAAKLTKNIVGGVC